MLKKNVSLTFRTKKYFNLCIDFNFHNCILIICYKTRVFFLFYFLTLAQCISLLLQSIGLLLLFHQILSSPNTVTSKFPCEILWKFSAFFFWADLELVVKKGQKCPEARWIRRQNSDDAFASSHKGIKYFLKVHHFFELHILQ